MPRRRNFAHSTIRATLATRYIRISPRMPQVLSSPTAVPGSVNAVETTPIRMLGATNATAGEDDPRGLGVGGYVRAGHAGQEHPRDQRCDERQESLGRGVVRVPIGG